MSELIALTILIGSILGMGVILYRKIPLLAELPEISEDFKTKNRFLWLKEKIKNLKRKLPPFEIFLQKILSKIRILILKLENKISAKLQKLREESTKKRKNEKYWNALKESIDEKKSEEENQPE